MVDQDRMFVEIYRHESSGWRGYLLNQPSDVVESSCLGLHVSLQQIYEGVELPPPGVTESELPEYAAIE
jgi:Uma2 family endonuclease